MGIAAVYGTGGGSLIRGDGTGNGKDNGEGGPVGTASGSDGERGEAGARGGTEKLGDRW